MEVLQPPSAAAPAPGTQMAPERRGGAQARSSLNAVHAAGTPCGGQIDGGKKRPRDNRCSRWATKAEAEGGR